MNFTKLPGECLWHVDQALKHIGCYAVYCHVITIMLPKKHIVVEINIWNKINLVQIIIHSIEELLWLLLKYNVLDWSRQF